MLNSYQPQCKVEVCHVLVIYGVKKGSFQIYYLGLGVPLAIGCLYLWKYRLLMDQITMTISVGLIGLFLLLAIFN